MSTEPKTTILVVDDDDANRYFKSHVLRGAGFRVVEAARGGESLTRIEADRPNVVLLDIRLPDMSGLDLCREIKARHPSTIVLQTSAAFTTTQDRATGLAGGADSYLVEPVEGAELIAVVRALTRLHKAEQQLRQANETLEQRVTERTRELAEANQQISEEAEKRAKAEETLRHAEKLDAIGQLTGGVAHDFNNLLTVVIGNLDILDRLLVASPIPVERVIRSTEAARRAALDCERLTQQLLSFARRDELRAEVVDLNSVITRFAPLLRHALGEQVSTQLALASELWTCRVDPKQFETALLNLVVNARDAMPLGGQIHISSANFETAGAGKRKRASFPDLAPGEYVHVCVGDRGTGMPPDIVAHVFEPFFTTKEIGQGSGLGLSQVYGFVKQSNGDITIDSALGRGTRVNLFLPRSAEAVAPAADARTASDPPGGSETILIVEDNALVLDLAAAMLADLGYRVTFASDGKSALDAIEREPKPDLLFTDVVMPNRMSGVELARIARQRLPGLKVLVTSGYSARLPDAEPIGGEFPSIAKPYHLADLAVRIRQVLDG